MCPSSPGGGGERRCAPRSGSSGPTIPRHRSPPPRMIVGVRRQAGDPVARAGGRGDLFAVDEDRVAGDEAAARARSMHPSSASSRWRTRRWRQGRSARSAPSPARRPRPRHGPGWPRRCNCPDATKPKLVSPSWARCRSRARPDHVAVAVVADDRGVPDVGDLVRHVDHDLPAGGRAAVVVHHDVAVEAAAPGIDQRELGLEVARRQRRGVVVDDGAGRRSRRRWWRRRRPPG